MTKFLGFLDAVQPVLHLAVDRHANPRTCIFTIVDGLRRPRNWRDRLAARDAGAHPAVRRSDWRPPVDSRRSRTRAARISVRRNDRARLSDAILNEPFHEGGDPVAERRAANHQLRAESRSFP